MFHSSQPSCPTCASKTMLARVAHGFSGFDIRTFECPVCDHIHQIVIDLADPMESTETNGRLHGLKRQRKHFYCSVGLEYSATEEISALSAFRTEMRRFGSIAGWSSETPMARTLALSSAVIPAIGAGFVHKTVINTFEIENIAWHWPPPTRSQFCSLS
jgi:hypothetical protein